MAPKQQKQIKKQSVGQHFVAIIDSKKYTLKADKDLRETLKKEIDAYNIKNSEERLKKIIRLLQPKQEKEKQLALAEKKKVHKKVKVAKTNLKEATKELASHSVDKTLSLEDEKFFKAFKEFKIIDGNLYLKPFDKVRMPQTLVTRFKEFIGAGTPLLPLINFWKLALLNPNEVARTKLFDYLTRQNLTITPAGYIVTYRMVKATDRVTPEGKPIYTSARTQKEDYIMGTAFSLPRTECDEDGSRDCSKGLHTGTHKFIGIIADKKISSDEDNSILGEGYGKGVKITTKMETPASYGTGYDRPQPIEVKTSVNFDHSFGNVAVICLVNPMHVVSVPDSDTRKMRSCELYFAGTTTPEEVIDLVEKDYHIFDHAYQQYEQEQIEKMLKEAKLKEHYDSIKLAKSVAKKKLAEEALQKAISSMIVGKDRVNTNQLQPKDIEAIVKSRLVVKSKK